MRAEIERAVQLLRRSDNESLEQALSLLQSTVYSFSMRVCGQREDAEDTSQEVLLKSLPYLPKISSPKALVVWLYKVAKNRCLMSRRKSKFAPKQELSLADLMPDRSELESLVPADGRVSPEDLAIRSQEAKRLREAIQKLPPQYRMVLVLRDMEGLTDEEVAEVTGLKPGNVRVRLHRARLFVRRELMKAETLRRAARGLASEVHPRPARCKAMFAELSNYLDETLDDSLCEELEAHLDGCAPCKAFVASLEKMIHQLRQMPADSPNEKERKKLRRELLTVASALQKLRGDKVLDSRGKS